MKECFIEENRTRLFSQKLPMYSVMLLKGKGNLTIDIASYDFTGNIMICTTPFQSVRLETAKTISLRILQFHGDYYCIEHHKKEVACNGLLFNNIYQQPFINLNQPSFNELHLLYDKMNEELNHPDAYAQAVARSYLQLVLALGSKAKASPASKKISEQSLHPVLRFKTLLEANFQTERQPAFYARELGMAVNTFSKKVKQYFQRSPSELIHERVILEAKKQIHLTYKSIKEIATILHFEDEHYFSRYFKKHTGVSPTMFREKVGISIVANLSS